MLRHWMSGMCAGQAADLSWSGTGAPRCILEEAMGWGLPCSVHRWHLVLMEAELFGFEAQAGDAVGHVHPLGGRCGPAGAVGGHSAVGREQGGMRQWPMEESPCPLFSCWLPRPGWLFPLGDLSQEQPRLQHFYMLGWMWEPLKLCTRRPCFVLLDVMAEHEQLGTIRDPCHLLCRDVGRVSTRPSKSLARTRMPAPALRCRDTGKPAQRWAADAQTELKWFPKPSQMSSFWPHKTPQTPSSGTGLHSCGMGVVSRQPCPVATSSPAPPEPSPTCTGRCWSKRDTPGSVQWVVVPWAAQWLLLGCRI